MMLARFAHWLGFALRLYPAWSRLYRWLYHRKYKRLCPRIPQRNVEQAQEIVDRLGWAKDGASAMFDAVGSPHRFEAMATGKVPVSTKDRDCDDNACWLAHTFGLSGQRMVQVAWKRGIWMDGHFVAVTYHPTGGMIHCGNWGVRGPFETLREVVEDILGDRELVGWAMLDHELRVLANDRKMPSDKPFPIGRQ